MVQVKEVKTNTGNLQQEINNFLKKEGIEKSELCDIKYHPGAVESSALIIYSKYEGEAD
jgi:hypothetical protein